MTGQQIIPRRAFIEVPHYEGESGPPNAFIQLPPTAMAFGYIFQLPTREKYKLLRSLHDKITSGEYTPIFNEIEQIAEQPVEEFIQSLEAAIIKEEGAKNLLRCDAKEVIKEVPLYGEYQLLQETGLKSYGKGIVADVKSISHGLRRGNRRLVLIYNLMKLHAGESTFHTSSNIDQFMGVSKSQRFGVEEDIPIPNYLFSKYEAAVAARYAEHVGLDSILPYNVVNNPLLAMEAVAVRYILGEKQYEIDRQLMLSEGNVSDSLIDKIKNHQARVMVQRDRRKKTDKPTDDLEGKLVKLIGSELAERGFEWIGYNTEFSEMPIEAVGYRWVSPKKDFTLVFPNDGPPLIVERNTELGGHFDMYKLNPRSQTDFDIGTSIRTGPLSKQIFFEGYLWDEMTRRLLHTIIRTPNPNKMKLPDNTKSRMRGFIHNAIGELEKQL